MPRANNAKVFTRDLDAPGGIGGLIAEYDTSAAATYYAHCEYLGNVNSFTDASGAIIQSYEYDAFGNIVYRIGTPDNRITYQAKEVLPGTDLTLFS
jgi:hypothetical protein